MVPGVVEVALRKGSLLMPKGAGGGNTPLLMIGPGTGCAPLRSMVMERAAALRAASASGGTTPPPTTMLFLGFRKRDDDALYHNEWQLLKAQSVVSDLHIAFSRDQSDKVYVQHLLRRHGQDVWNRVLCPEAGGYVYLSGSAKQMPQDVWDALVYILQTFGGQSDVEATAYLRKMERGNRYQAECWS